MKKGQHFLLLRYSNNIVPNTIEQHTAIIEELGYCWFGKIGIVPSPRIQRELLAEEEPRIILYSRGVAHECLLLAISEKKPSNGCPKYYETEGVYPSVYFKLGFIEPIHIAELDRYRIVSTGRTLTDAIWHSMTSYFFAEWPDGISRLAPQKTITTVKKEKTRELLPPNDCVYRKNGKCTCRSCISYQYECERPSMCLKQKRGRRGN